MSPLRPLIAALLLLGACADRPPAGDADALAEYQANNDPIEPTNRFFYRINDGIDTYFLAPVARGYRYAVPEVVRRPIHNVVANITTPVIFANDVLQARPRRAGDSMMRFLINSTAGVGGLFDVATDLGYPEHNSGFGTTLALWGVGEGPFLFLPVLGPSNPRDTVGFAGNVLLDPLTFATFGGSRTLGFARYGTAGVDARERALDPIDNIKKSALDPYATFRSLYRQNRQSEIEARRVPDPATVPAWFKR